MSTMKQPPQKPLTLYPLDFETALGAALQVEPPPKATKKEPTPPKERRPRKNPGK